MAHVLMLMCADEQKVKKINGWIGSIADIHKSKPPATVTYSRRMPDIEALMQVGPWGIAERTFAPCGHSCMLLDPQGVLHSPIRISISSGT